ncbi:hypothetical protein CO038_04500 [Candidatus Pacearchaeota archaeon CG_4_9_14_0_2_um_filter_39_13]|nr:phosphotransferase [Candidatus Pacearchaeota archaeon]OIO42581.1 MAG: hypothetical protein AUJ64_03810 [Candidatus Pacearchaeota archaeon CG1_02_39_14]PJC44329.1 MAG: hypothetical protein CO038_04500 [Candidatus Pacearchaeota archaeon CG_4_9_14_0_2_um_filter_39_13]
MGKTKFDYHRVEARKDLLDFIVENGDKKLYEHIGENPSAWIDELDILSAALTGQPLIGAIGLNPAPIGDPGFIELGNDAFLYKGEDFRLKGLWTRRDEGESLRRITGDRYEWTHYRTGSRAVLAINREFSRAPFEQFLPGNFERVAKPFQSEKGQPKRPISTFPARLNGKEITVFAKGSELSMSYFFSHSKPGYRLTDISRISRATSKEEMETTLKLGELGIRVPRVIGYYESATEDFLFVEKVEGRHPDRFLPDEKRTIIEQDAAMLAALCLTGYRKGGFTDFDDKIFDGTNLYLIDVDECRDLYYPARPDFREMLLNPGNTKALSDFRRQQRKIFIGTMRDAIFRYQSSLTPTEEDKILYVQTFYRELGWKQPSQETIREHINFPKDYMTVDSWLAVMSDSD